MFTDNLAVFLAEKGQVIQGKRPGKQGRGKFFDPDQLYFRPP
jgi:hypothetical protein